MIEFKYKEADILNNAQILSLYRANALLQHNEEIPLDDSAATYEDDSMLINLLHKGAGVVGASLAGYGKALYDTDGITLLPAVEFVSQVVADPDSDPVIDAVDAQVIFRINMPDTFSNDLVLPIDQAIRDTLESYVLYRIMKLKGHNYESYYDDYVQGLSQIMAYVSQRTKPIRRSYTMF